MSKPFDCEHTCKYCTAVYCEERQEPFYQTIATFSFPAYSPVKVYIDSTLTKIDKITINGRVVKQN